LIRFLQQKYQKKFEVVVNAGDEQSGPVKLSGPAPYFPDLVLLSKAKIAGLVEVETGESTNNLEALAQWQHFARARVPFYLYVPVLMLDAALRFCENYKINVTEIWTFRTLYEGFDLVRAFHEPSAVSKTPRGVSATAKLLPPVTRVKPEPEKDARLAELSSLVELANRTFKAAQGKSLAATVAAKAAARAAKKAAKAAAANKAAGKPPLPDPKAAEIPSSPAVTSNAAKGKAVPKADKSAAKVAKVAKVAKKTKPAAKAVKAVKPAKPTKAAAKPAKPARKPAAKKAKPKAAKAKAKPQSKSKAGTSTPKRKPKPVARKKR
jgi:hypothetical protein